MLDSFQSYIKKHDLFHSGAHLVVAVSGGVDSMVLLDLLRRIRDDWDLKITVAHVNYQLRGKESDHDQQLVQDFCDAYDVPVYVHTENTEVRAAEEKKSIQLMAREIRYFWFRHLARSEKDIIVTAHHSDDNVETILHNLTKGTSISGLRGMLPKNNQNVVRPLLNQSKEEILNYANQHQIPWRNDSSNQKPDYTRNHIRLKVLPLLKQINPALLDHFDATHERLLGVDQLVADKISDIRSDFCSEEGGRISVSTAWIKEDAKSLMLLFELTKGYGFIFKDVQNIHDAVFNPEGQLFSSSSHRLNINRDFILIEELRLISHEAEMRILEDELEVQYGNWKYRIAYRDISDVRLSANKEIAFLDRDQLKYPLKLRRWEHGDKMQPFGMVGHKKVSDLLIDEKVSNMDKEHTHVLMSGDEIIWVAGLRISHVGRVTNKTKKVVEFTRLPCNR